MNDRWWISSSNRSCDCEILLSYKFHITNNVTEVNIYQFKIQMNYPIEFKQKNQTKGLTQTDK